MLKDTPATKRLVSAQTAVRKLIDCLASANAALFLDEKIEREQTVQKLRAVMTTLILSRFVCENHDRAAESATTHNLTNKGE